MPANPTGTAARTVTGGGFRMGMTPSARMIRFRGVAATSVAASLSAAVAGGSGAALGSTTGVMRGAGGASGAFVPSRSASTGGRRRGCVETQQLSENTDCVCLYAETTRNLCYDQPDALVDGEIGTPDAICRGLLRLQFPGWNIFPVVLSDSRGMSCSGAVEQA